MNNETEKIDTNVPVLSHQENNDSNTFHSTTTKNDSSNLTTTPVFLSNIIASTSQQNAGGYIRNTTTTTMTTSTSAISQQLEYPRFYAPYSNYNNNVRPKRAPQNLHRPAFVPPQPVLSPYYYSLSYVLPQYIVPTVRPPPILYCPPPMPPALQQPLRNSKFLPANHNNNSRNGGARSYAKTANGNIVGHPRRTAVVSEKAAEKATVVDNDNDGDLNNPIIVDVYSKVATVPAVEESCDKAVETDRQDEDNEEPANHIFCNGSINDDDDDEHDNDDDIVAQENVLQNSNCDNNNTDVTGELPAIDRLNINNENQSVQNSTGKSWASLFKSSPPPHSSLVSSQSINNANNVNNNVDVSVKSSSSNNTNVSPAEDNSNKVGIAAQQDDHSRNEMDDNDVNDSEIVVCNVDRDTLAVQLGASLKSYSLMHRGPAFQLRGLINNGNWCYVNSVLHALMACPPFVHLFRHLKLVGWSQRSPASTPMLDAFVQFVGEFGEKIGRKNVQPLDNKGVPFKPVYIYNVLKAMKRDNLLKGHYEDAEIFLNLVFNRLHDEMSRCIKVAEKTNDIEAQNQLAQNDDINNAENCNDDDEEWQQVGPHRKAVMNKTSKFSSTPVSEIFSGVLRNTVQQANSKEVVNLDSFFTLQLNIQGADITSVSSALFQLNNYKSTVIKLKNGQTQSVRRWTTFQDLPCVLVLNLKYFVSTDEGLKKSIKPIHYGIDLQIDWNLLSPTSPFRSKTDKFFRWYKLFAVVFHHGDKVENGYYTTDIFHAGFWLHVTDTDITVVDESHVLGFEPPRVPYLLFYRRCDLFSEQR